MRCRRIKEYVDENGNKFNKIVWFGSYGKDNLGNALLYNPENKHDNFGEDEIAIKDLLIQQLSVLKNELWYDIMYGMPLLNKQKSKLSIDSFVIATINTNKNVREILEFKSQIINKHYSCYVKVNTNFGEIEINM